MTAAEAARLTDVGVRFRKVWALRHATTVIPTGSVVAVVGTNGAGKSSMIRALVGLQIPTEGSIEVFGAGFRTDDPAHLARIGYVSQRKPLYGSLRVHEMLRYGAVSNPGWNAAYAQRRIADVGVDPQQRIDRLSGGQRTQVALTMALAKEPELLVLDEPLSDLDPLARREVLNGLMAEVAERGITVVLSSHILGELEHTCDQVVVLDAGRIVLAGEIESIVGEHLLLTGPAEALPQLSRQGDIVDHQQEGVSVRVLVRLPTIDPRFLDPRWQRHRAGMDSVVLGHLRAQGLASEPPTALRIIS